jgi:hypothetical protein
LPPFRQRQFKPAGAVGVAAAGLPSRLLRRDAECFRTIPAADDIRRIGKNAQLPVARGREFKAGNFFF